jgi:AcrR family transcriptional regulator
LIEGSGQPPEINSLAYALDQREMGGRRAEMGRTGRPEGHENFTTGRSYICYGGGVMVDGRVARGDRTRTAVLDAAVGLATKAGLDGLSLAQLADALGVSKSGLFAHWRSKEDLQLATIEHAREQWLRHVIGPALKAPRGVRRVWALHVRRLDFYSRGVLPGGCFFGNTEFEYNAKPGVIRDRLAESFHDWMTLIERLVSEAIDAGELASTAEPRQLAYEIEALGLTSVMQARLLSDAAYTFSRRAVLARLRSLCPDPTLLPEDAT